MAFIFNTKWCIYKHHEKYGEELEPCKECDGPITCGPFDHACEECEPNKFNKCTLCRSPRIFCYC